MDGLKNIAKHAAVKIKEIMGKVGVISPFIVIDNLDMQERVHYARLDASTHMYHGTWGYIHELALELTAGLDLDAFSLERI